MERVSGADVDEGMAEMSELFHDGGGGRVIEKSYLIERERR